LEIGQPEKPAGLDRASSCLACLLLTHSLKCPILKSFDGDYSR
jgi:hypothetical protein